MELSANCVLPPINESHQRVLRYQRHPLVDSIHIDEQPNGDYHPARFYYLTRYHKGRRR